MIVNYLYLLFLLITLGNGRIIYILFLQSVDNTKKSMEKYYLEKRIAKDSIVNGAFTCFPLILCHRRISGNNKVSL